MMTEYRIFPIEWDGNRFSQNCDLMVLEWDSAGKYLGQWQPDMIGEDAWCSDIFISANPFGENPDDLSVDQMARARTTRMEKV